MVAEVSAQHAVGQADMIVQPAGQVADELASRIGIAAPDAPVECFNPGTGGLVLMAVPLIKRVPGGAHLAFLVREMLRRVDDQVFHYGLNFGLNFGGRRGRRHGALQIGAETEDVPMFVVHRGNMDGVRFAPFRYRHANICIIPRRA
jgi:hypothetical protein